MLKSQPTLRIGETENLPLNSIGSNLIASRMAYWLLLAISCCACLMALVAHPKTPAVFFFACITTLAFVLWRVVAGYVERWRARRGGALWASDQDAGFDNANLQVRILFVTIATALLLWLAPMAPAFRWLFLGLAGFLVFNAIWALISSAISICKRRHADASLRLTEVASHAQALVEVILPQDDVSARCSAVLELFVVEDLPFDSQTARLLDVASAEMTKQDANTVSMTLSRLDPRILVMLRKQRRVVDPVSKEIYILTRVTVTSEQRTYVFYWV